MAETVVFRRMASYWSRSQTVSVRYRPRLFVFSTGADGRRRRDALGVTPAAAAAAARWSPLPCPSAGSTASSASCRLSSGSAGGGAGWLVGLIRVDGSDGIPLLLLAMSQDLRE